MTDLKKNLWFWDRLHACQSTRRNLFGHFPQQKKCDINVPSCTKQNLLWKSRRVAQTSRHLTESNVTLMFGVFQALQTDKSPVGFRPDIQTFDKLMLLGKYDRGTITVSIIFICQTNPTSQPTTVVCKMKARSGRVLIACTSLRLFAPTCTLSRSLSTKFLHRNSAGSLLGVCCWLGKGKKKLGDATSFLAFLTSLWGSGWSC